MVNQAGGEILLDERVRRAGSHHQKLVLVRHPGREHDDVAFVGGIDLCHGRRDDERHHGDPQAIDIGPKYGERPPWHDIQAEIRGPAVGDLSTTFRERWDDPTPLDHRNPWRARIARVAQRAAAGVAAAASARDPRGRGSARRAGPAHVSVQAPARTRSPPTASAASPGPTARCSAGPAA